MGASGWISAKLDVKLEVDALSHKVDTLSGSVAVLTSQQQDLVKSIGKLSSDDEDAPGPIFVLRREMKYANRKIVEATAIALAYESAARKAAKRRAAEPLLSAYDNRLKEKEQPSAAAGEVLREIALP
jgi:peptidoglycan hydrolase CwlO-like protein